MILLAGRTYLYPPVAWIRAVECPALLQVVRSVSDRRRAPAHVERRALSPRDMDMVGTAIELPQTAPVSADPRRVADVVLAAAVRSGADAVFVEPLLGYEECYVITIERTRQVLATSVIDASLGAAVIARLAFLASLDLAASHASSGLLPIRSGTLEAEVMLTVRPVPRPRADLMVVSTPRVPALTLSEPTVGPTVGVTFDHYTVTALLAEGGMGTVFQVEHATLGRTYAMKVLRRKVVEREPDAVEQFLREARTAARIRHPNIVDVFDFGYMADGRPYLVMELLEGESLADMVDRGPLQIRDVVHIAKQLASGLAAAHECGVIHADVTPSNVLVLKGPGPHAKLVDFGLSKLAGDGLMDEIPEYVLGTPAYISPEQLRGLTATERSDQYGLGAVLFELIVGHPPFEHKDIRELSMMHLMAPVPAIESPHGPLPSKLADVVNTCLQKRPQSRFPSVRALLSALEEIEKTTDRSGWQRWLST